MQDPIASAYLSESHAHNIRRGDDTDSKQSELSAAVQGATVGHMSQAGIADVGFCPISISRWDRGYSRQTPENVSAWQRSHNLQVLH